MDKRVTWGNARAQRGLLLTLFESWRNLRVSLNECLAGGMTRLLASGTDHAPKVGVCWGAECWQGQG